MKVTDHITILDGDLVHPDSTDRLRELIEEFQRLNPGALVVLDEEPELPPEGARIRMLSVGCHLTPAGVTIDGVKVETVEDLRAEDLPAKLERLRKATVAAVALTPQEVVSGGSWVGKSWYGGNRDGMSVLVDGRLQHTCFGVDWGHEEPIVTRATVRDGVIYPEPSGTVDGEAAAKLKAAEEKRRRRRERRLRDLSRQP